MVGAGGSRARHWHLVDALHRHARLRAAGARLLRRAAYAALAGDRRPIRRAGVQMGERRAVRLGGFLIGGVLVGCGIAGMHYVGMAALKMQPPIRYARALVALSILIAISAAKAAQWCTFMLRMDDLFSAFWKKAGSSVIMGTAIYGLHYTGMT